jgi:Astacin (Peptidase family M12A)
MKQTITILILLIPFVARAQLYNALSDFQQYEEIDMQFSPNSPIQRITVGVKDSFYVFGGDMLIKRNPTNIASNELKTRGFIFKWLNKWPGQAIPYKIDRGMPCNLVVDILTVIDTINAKTNICIYPATVESSYIKFSLSKNDDGWSSASFGAVPNTPTDIILSAKAPKQTIAHEILHTLGIGHEHQRYDRDKYVRIECNNCSNRILGALGIVPQIQGKTFETLAYDTYDYHSVMNYVGYVIPLDPTKTIRRPFLLSEGDIATINFIYPKPICEKPTQPFFTFTTEEYDISKGSVFQLKQKCINYKRNIYKWTFNGADISSSNEENPKVRFLKSGNFDIVLEIYPTDSTVLQFKKTITVRDEMTKLSVSPTLISKGDALVEIRAKQNSRVQLKLINLVGEILLSRSFIMESCNKTISLDLKNTPSGILFLHLNSLNEYSINKIMIVN